MKWKINKKDDATALLIIITKSTKKESHGNKETY
jgi:hypothetical protein